MFLANYSDGLTDAPLPEMIQTVQGKRQDRLLHRDPPADQLSSGGIRWQRFCPAHPFQSGIGNLDQRWLLHLPPGDFRFHQGWRRTCHGAVQSPDRRRPSHGLQVRWLLAGDGYATRPSGTRRYGRTGRYAVVHANASTRQSRVMRAAAFSQTRRPSVSTLLGCPFGRHRDRGWCHAAQPDGTRNSSRCSLVCPERRPERTRIRGQSLRGRFSGRMRQASRSRSDRFATASFPSRAKRSRNGSSRSRLAPARTSSSRTGATTRIRIIAKYAT